jgi:hypothetical protein
LSKGCSSSEIPGEVKPIFISEIWVPEGIGDREFENNPYELLVHKIMLTVGSRGRTTTIDFPWKQDTSVSVFRDSAYWEPY